MFELRWGVDFDDGAIWRGDEDFCDPTVPARHSQPCLLVENLKAAHILSAHRAEVINRHNDGTTPPVLAVYKGQLKLESLSLEHRVNTNPQQEDLGCDIAYDFPLHKAAKDNKVDTMQRLADTFTNQKIIMATFSNVKRRRPNAMRHQSEAGLKDCLSNWPKRTRCIHYFETAVFARKRVLGMMNIDHYNDYDKTQLDIVKMLLIMVQIRVWTSTP